MTAAAGLLRLLSLLFVSLAPLLILACTEQAATPTTPAPVAPTPDIEATVQAAMARALASPQPTPDIQATVEALVAEALEAERDAAEATASAAPSPTPFPSPTPGPSLVPSPAPTVARLPTPSSGPGSTPTSGSPANEEFFSRTGSMRMSRWNHRAFRLPDGQVLVLGDLFGPGITAERYDPSDRSWQSSGREGDDEFRGGWYTATLLRDGTVLVAGGPGPVGLNRMATIRWALGSGDTPWKEWRAAGEMLEPREGHSATLLEDGSVLVAGGISHDPAATGLTVPVKEAVRSCEMWDPFTEVWTPTAGMNEPRVLHMATRLGNGHVLVVGGYGFPWTEFKVLDSAETFDPQRRQWVSTTPMAGGRTDATLTLLADGRVLVAGGYSENRTLDTAEVFDLPTETWSSTASMHHARMEHAAVLLADDRVLVVGGRRRIGDSSERWWSSEYLDSAELFDPASGTWSLVGPMTIRRAGATATLLLDGRVLIAGGQDEYGPVASAELFEPPPK